MLVRQPINSKLSDQRGMKRREARIEERQLKRLTEIKPIKAAKGFA